MFCWNIVFKGVIKQLSLQLKNYTAIDTQKENIISLNKDQLFNH